MSDPVWRFVWLSLVAICWSVPVGAQTFTWKEGAQGATQRWVDGDLIRRIQTRQAIVEARIRLDHGQIAAGVGVTNRGPAIIDVIPDSFSIQVMAPKERVLLPVDKSKEAGKISAWTRMAEVAGGAAAGYSDAAGTTATVANSDGSTSQVNIRNTGHAAADQQQAREKRRAESARAQASIQNISLKAQTLRPSEGIAGFVWFQKAKSHVVMIRVPLMDAIYEFPFDGIP